jgi:hypothetical protein
MRRYWFPQVGQPAEETPTYGEIGPCLAALCTTRRLYPVIICHCSIGVEVHLPPLCSPRFTSIQAQQDQSKALEAYIQELILRLVLHQLADGRSSICGHEVAVSYGSCQVLRREELCVKEGNHVWKLLLDLVCLSHEGNIRDAMILAAMAALTDVAIPAVSVKVEEVLLLRGECYCVQVRDTFALKFLVLLRPPAPARRLTVQRLPVPVSFGIFQGQLVCDLSSMEENVIRSQVTVVLGDNGEVRGFCYTLHASVRSEPSNEPETSCSSQVCSINQPGGAVLPAEQLETCLDICSARCAEIRRLLGHS